MSDACHDERYLHFFNLEYLSGDFDSDTRSELTGYSSKRTQYSYACVDLKAHKVVWYIPNLNIGLSLDTNGDERHVCRSSACVLLPPSAPKGQGWKQALVSQEGDKFRPTVMDDAVFCASSSAIEVPKRSPSGFSLDR